MGAYENILIKTEILKLLTFENWYPNKQPQGGFVFD